MNDFLAQLAGDNWNDRTGGGYRTPPRHATTQLKGATRMAQQLTIIQATVTKVSDKGFKIAEGDKWLNWSRFTDDRTTPPVGARVSVSLDDREFVRAVDVIQVATPAQAVATVAQPATLAPATTPIAAQTAPEATLAPSTAPSIVQDDRGVVVSRLAVLNTATAILSSGGRATTADDVIALAARLEVWATR